MSRLPIQKVPTTEDRTLPIFSEIDMLADRIRDRAYELFSRRGFSHGHALDDWLAAEQQVLLPEAELVEEDDEFELNLAMPGFESEDVDVTATPTELIIKASREQREEDDSEEAQWSSFQRAGVYRRVRLPGTIDVDHVTAKLAGGVLAIEAPKAGAKKAATRKAKKKPAAKKKAKSKVKARAKTKTKKAKAKSARAAKKPAKKAAKKTTAKASKKTSARKK